VALVLINSACGALGWLLNLYYAKRLLPSLHISIPLFNKAMVRTLFGLAIAIFIIDACVMIMTHTDKLIIGAFLTAGMIPFYEAAYKIFRLMAIAPMLLGKAVLPAASELDAFHDIHSLQSLFLRGTKYTTAIFLAIAIPATLLSKQILIYWMGKEFGSHYLLIAIFVLFELFSFHYLFALNLLIGINKVKVALFYHIGSAMLNLILSIILVQRIGLIGVVWGTAIPAIVLVPVFMLYILKTFKVDLITYFKQVIGRTYPQAGIIALLLYVVTLYHLPRSLGEVGIFAILSIGAYFALFYLFGTAAWEKKDLIAMGRGVCLVK
jgi:O-antigen/teichoic acid export membrane protein